MWNLALAHVAFPDSKIHVDCLCFDLDLHMDGPAVTNWFKIAIQYEKTNSQVQESTTTKSAGKTA